jgi:hypothetical protein
MPWGQKNKNGSRRRTSGYIKVDKKVFNTWIQMPVVMRQKVGFITCPNFFFSFYFFFNSCNGSFHTTYISFSIRQYE